MIEDGLSRQQAADLFGIAASTAVLRIDRQRELGSAATAEPGCDHRIGSAAASAMGSGTPGRIAGAYADRLHPRGLQCAFTLRPRDRERAFARRGAVKELASERALIVDGRSEQALVRTFAAIVQVGARPRPKAIV